jgi:hypothetical protein
MKRSVALAIFSIAVFVMNIVTIGHAQNKTRCSTASVAGKWAFTSTGTLILPTGPVQVAAVATFTADASGNISGSQTRSLGGDVADETFTGTASVNPDCTGTNTIQVFEGGVLVRTTTLHVVYDDNGQEARAVFTSLVLPDGTSLPSIITIEARRVFSKKSD